MNGTPISDFQFPIGGADAPDLRRNILRVLLTAALLSVALGVSCDSRGRGGAAAGPVTMASSPAGIMGTQTELTVVVGGGDAAAGRAALQAAEGALRDVEAMMSPFLAASPLSRFNAAPAGEAVPLPAELAGLLERARTFTERSDGAFDVTVGPIVQLWKRAGKAGRVPRESELAEARARVGMENLTVSDGEAVKKIDGLELDLGAIAKGYGVDKAAEAMRRTAGVRGGLVNVGGEVRSFGAKGDGAAWRIGVRHPFRQGLYGVMVLGESAVATSGDYERFVEIGGVRYSHIVDPRTAQPVRQTHSVTVVSRGGDGRQPSCTDADAWATALSVMGAAGLGRLDGTGIEALVISGTPEKPEIQMTPGFATLLEPGTKIQLD